MSSMETQSNFVDDVRADEFATVIDASVNEGHVEEIVAIGTVVSEQMSTTAPPIPPPTPPAPRATSSPPRLARPVSHQGTPASKGQHLKQAVDTFSTPMPPGVAKTLVAQGAAAPTAPPATGEADMVAELDDKSAEDIKDDDEASHHEEHVGPQPPTGERMQDELPRFGDFISVLRRQPIFHLATAATQGGGKASSAPIKRKLSMEERMGDIEAYADELTNWAAKVMHKLSVQVDANLDELDIRDRKRLLEENYLRVELRACNQRVDQMLREKDDLRYQVINQSHRYTDGVIEARDNRMEVYNKILTDALDRQGDRAE